MLTKASELVMRIAESPDLAPAPCGKCGNDMRQDGGRFIRDPISGCEVLLCDPCASGFVQWRLESNMPLLLERAGVPRRYWLADEAKIPVEVRGKIVGWAGNPEFLLLEGATGSGKSFAAATIVKRLASTGQRWRWVSMLTLMRDLKRDLDAAPALAASVEAAPHLVLDDLGAERLTDYAIDILVTLVSARWDAMLPTVITTNVEITVLDKLNPRLTSRLVSGVLVAFPAVDRRLPA